MQSPVRARPLSRALLHLLGLKASRAFTPALFGQGLFFKLTKMVIFVMLNTIKYGTTVLVTPDSLKGKGGRPYEKKVKRRSRGLSYSGFFIGARLYWGGSSLAP